MSADFFPPHILLGTALQLRGADIQYHGRRIFETGGISKTLGFDLDKAKAALRAAADAIDAYQHAEADAEATMDKVVNA